mgnify:CR=1 FL=1
MSVNLFGGNKFIELKRWTFPGGERGVTIVDPVEIDRYRSFTINCHFEGSDDILDILLLANACRSIRSTIGLRLCIPYLPYARQDRVSSPGDSFSLQVLAQVINTANFDEIEVWDVHSDVAAALFPVGKLLNKPQQLTLYPLLSNLIDYDKVAIVAPDAGAYKKAHKIAEMLSVPVVQATKVRDPKSGQIVETKLDCDNLNDYNSIIVVDDICDGGKTFIELAKVIRKTYDKQLSLAVTHGIFSKGKACLYKYYDYVVAANQWKQNEQPSFN